MPRRLPEYESKVSLNRGDRSALSNAISGPSNFQSVAEGIAAVSGAVFEVQRKRDTSRMLKGITDIEIGLTQRMQQLSAEGAGDKPISQAAMEEFQKTADEFLAAQPSYVKEDAKRKLLSLKETVARTSLSIQANVEAKELALEVKDFSNNTINQVRMGIIGEEEALLKADEYIGTLPQNVQSGLRSEFQEAIKLSTLSNIAESNPYEAVKKIKSGAYNDVSPARLESVMDSARREIAARENRAISLQNKAITSRYTDPYSAANLWLNSKGISDPNDDQIRAAYDELGVPNEMRFHITKAVAEDLGFRLRTAETKQEFFAGFSAAKQAYTQNGKDEQEFVRAMQKLGGLPASASELLDYDPAINGNDPETTKYTDYLFEMNRDKDAGKNSRAVLNSIDPEYNKQIAEATAAIMQEQLVLGGYTGDTESMAERNSFYQDVLSIAAQRTASTSGGKPKKVVEDAVRSVRRAENSAVVVSGNDAYRVPYDLAPTITPKLMGKVKSNIIGSDDFFISPAIEALGDSAKNEVKRSLSVTTGWRSSGKDSYVLIDTASGTTQYKKSGDRLVPIEVTTDELILLNEAERELSTPREMERMSQELDMLTRMQQGLGR